MSCLRRLRALRSEPSLRTSNANHLARLSEAIVSLGIVEGDFCYDSWGRCAGTRTALNCDTGSSNGKLKRSPCHDIAVTLGAVVVPISS